MLGLADDPPAAAPVVERRPQEVLKAPCRSAGRDTLDRRFGEFGPDLIDQAGIAGEAKQVIDAVGLAPRHQWLAGKARIGAQHDPHFGPASSDLPGDTRDLLDRTGRAVDVRAPQLRGRRMAATENIERPGSSSRHSSRGSTGLPDCHGWIIDGVEIEHDLLGRLCMCLEEDIDQQRLDRLGTCPIL